MASESPQFPTRHIPQRSDSRRAAIAPESAFMANFKQTLLGTGHFCTRRECCSFFTFDNEAISPLATTESSATNPDEPVMALATPNHEPMAEPPAPPQQSQPEGGDQVSPSVRYPLLVFADFPTLPSGYELNALLREYHDVFVPSAPFFSSWAISSPNAPPYLVLCMALLGASISKDVQHSSWSSNLWRAAYTLVLGALEVDNTLARKTEWMQAALLFVAYGNLQANSHVWSKTMAVLGYLDAIFHRNNLKRMPLQQMFTPSPFVSTHFSASTGLVCSYYLIDTIHAAHLNRAPTLQAAELSFPLTHGRDFKSLYRTLVVDHAPLPAGLSSDEYVLLLVALLSDTISFHHAYGSLVGDRGTGVHLDSRPDSRASNGWEHSRDNYFNPLVPFSGSDEYQKVKGRLIKALDIWRTSVGMMTPDHQGHVAVDGTIIPLMHFCRMVLESDFAVWLLPAWAKYTPLSDLTTDYRDPHAPMPRPHVHFGNAAQSSAWQILETVEADDHHSDLIDQAQSSPITPLWYPVILFYAALVIWARMVEDHDTRHSCASGGSGGGVLLARKKILSAFQSELERMKPQWECTKRMVATIKALK